MKTIATTLAVFGLSALPVPGMAAPLSPPPNGVFGILGTNGTFRPVLGQPGSGHPPARVVQGKLELTLNVTIASALPPATGILCGLDATVTGVAADGTADTILEADQVLANVSGATATCTMSIPYLWHLVAADDDAVLKDTVQLSYTITAVGAGEQGRTTLASFSTIALPKNGRTTSFDLAAKI